MTAAEVWTKVKTLGSKIWASKIGKALIIILVVLAIAIPSGGIGKMVGCVQAKTEAKAEIEILKDQLKEAQKAKAEALKQNQAKDSEITDLQEKITKLDKKKKKK